jgi:hypothetical protein
MKRVAMRGVQLHEAKHCNPPRIVRFIIAELSG